MPIGIYNKSKYYFQKGHKSFLPVGFVPWNKGNKTFDKEKYRKEYYLRNREEIRKKGRKYYIKNSDKIKNKVNEYRLKNLDVIAEKKKEYILKNKDKERVRNKTWRENNKDKIKDYYTRNRKRVSKNHNEYMSKRIKNDIGFKLQCCLRSRLVRALKINQRTGSAIRDLGCTIPELKTHIEKQFQTGMTWDNWSRIGWHIDHIIPLDVFDLTDREQFLKACHYTNLQPMWAKENIKKSNKII